MNILLTGATSGIGFEALKSLVKKGYYVFAIGRDFKKIEEFYIKNKRNIKKIEFDLNNLERYEELFLSFDLKSIKFDALLHCAGIEETIPLSLYKPNKVNDIFKINVFSSIELLRLFTKKKYSNNGASVVLLSSVMGELGQPGKVGYCSSKAAISGLVRSSALELVKRKIRINCVLPGIINTPLSKKIFSSLNKDNIKKIKDLHPMGFGEVSDVVPILLFLISEDSKWITGQGFVVDGGYSIM